MGSFIYAGRPYYDDARILCMANFLFQVQQSNRLKQKGLLRRFSIACYGTQKTLGDIRGDRASKFLELKNKRGTKEYDEWFLKYRPGDGKDVGVGKSTGSKTGSTTGSKTMKKNAPIKKRKSARKRPSTRKNFLARFLR